jgi:uncharacterized Rmd1/YagE family protein
MRCSYFCVANGIDLTELVRFLRKNEYTFQTFIDAVHVYDAKEQSNVFYFSNGTVVTWNVHKKKVQKKLSLVKDFLFQKVSPIEKEECLYIVGEKTSIVPHPYFNVEVLTLDSHDVELKLALSYGFSQSIKLQMYQRNIERLIEKNSPIVSELAETGKIHQSNKQISKIIGSIFVAKSLVTLKSEFLMTPKFFWRSPGLESYYVMLERYLDLGRRVTALNLKLDTLNQIFDMLNGQLQSRHSHFLELIIIVLIALEIFFNLLHL